MSTRSEAFGRLLKGAINAIAAYEGKTAPVVEEDLGAQIGVAGSAIQRYKAGYLPPEPRAIAVFAEAGVRRGFLARAWLSRFLQAARYPTPEALFAQLADALGVATPGIQGGLPGGTVALLAVDIPAAAQRWEQQPRQMESVLERHDALLRQAIDAFGGQVFRAAGDACYAVFTTVPAALEAALAAQRVLQTEDWRLTGPFLTRVALHAGTPQVLERDYAGPPLHRVAAMLAAAHGGQVLLSHSAHELTHDLLPPGVTLRDLGEHRLADLSRPERLFQLVAAGLPAAFPPLRTLDVYRTNLPPQPTPLIGREAELADVSEFLDRAEVRLLTLTGPGGIGKTRLALQAAAERVATYRDGVVFVPLATVSDPERVAAAIAQALGVREPTKATPEAHAIPLAGDQLLAMLGPRHMLLVLDNFEQVVEAAPIIGALLGAAPGVQVLTTSRAPLRLAGEQEYAVPPLELPAPGRAMPLERLTQLEAVRLFIARAQAVRPDFAVTAESAPSIAEICVRLDGLPLAIELAAARSKLFPPHALLARLDQRLRLLRDGPRDLPARQQTLANAIAWSYDLLAATEQVIFARLGVFTGGCTLEAVEAVIGDDGTSSELAAYVPEEAILAGIGALVDHSLLRQVTGADGEPRFVMLETIREFALERLAASGEAHALHARHARYYHDLTEHGQIWLYGPELTGWLRRQRAERANVRAAIEWSLSDGDPALAIGMLGALASRWEWEGEGTDVSPNWLPLFKRALMSGAGTPWQRGRMRLAAAPLEQELAAMLWWLPHDDGVWEPVGDPALAVELRRVQLVLMHWRFNHAATAEYIDELLSFAQQAGNPRSVIDLHIYRGHEQLRSGDEAAAHRSLDAALARCREIHCVKLTASILRHMAVLLDATPEQRAAWLDEAEQLLEANGERAQLAEHLRTRAGIARISGDLELAQQFLDRSVTLVSAEPDLFTEIDVEFQHAQLALQRGDLRTAARSFQRSLSITPIASYSYPTLWHRLTGLARVAAKAGDPARAARIIGMTTRLYADYPYSYQYFSRIARQRYQHDVAAVRAALGDEPFAGALAAGKALAVEQAVAEVLALPWDIIAAS